MAKPLLLINLAIGDLNGHSLLPIKFTIHMFSSSWSTGIWVDNPLLPGQPPACSRWFFSTECLLAQAFPVHPIINKGWKVCPFNFPRAQRKSHQVCAQAGNSMSIVCTYILCALHGMVCHRIPVFSDRKRDWETNSSQKVWTKSRRWGSWSQTRSNSKQWFERQYTRSYKLFFWLHVLYVLVDLSWFHMFLSKWLV